MHRQMQMEPEGSAPRKEHKIEAQVWGSPERPCVSRRIDRAVYAIYTQ